MAYLKDVYKPFCYRCRKPATVKLYSHRNEPLNFYCKPCGNTALREMKKEEGQEF